MIWNVTFYDDDTGYAYRVRVKRLTVGDAVSMDTLSDDITRRETLKGRELLMLSQQYPFVRYCTAACEWVVLDDAPEDDPESGEPIVSNDEAWEAFDLTEAAFMALPEWLSLRWNYAAVKKNPHRDPMYEALKKKLLMGKLQQMSAPTISSDSDSVTDSDNGSSSD